MTTQQAESTIFWPWDLIRLCSFKQTHGIWIARKNQANDEQSLSVVLFCRCQAEFAGIPTEWCEGLCQPNWDPNPDAAWSSSSSSSSSSSHDNDLDNLEDQGTQERLSMKPRIFARATREPTRAAHPCRMLRKMIHGIWQWGFLI